MILLVVLFSLWGMTGCTSSLTPKQKRSEIDQKYPGINYGTLAGYDGHEKEKSQIDYSEYLPKKSMIKRYTNRSSPGFYGVKIIRDGDQLTYMHNRIGTSKNSIAYDVVLKIDKEYIFEYLNTFKIKKTKRIVSIGDVTSLSIDDELSQERCILKERLKEFSYKGYSFKGDIIHERCKNIYLSQKATDIYDQYSQKGLGMIATINDSCYQGSNRYPTDTEGCTPNHSTYRVYVKNK
jgi:hypothetical protein